MFWLRIFFVLRLKHGESAADQEDDNEKHSTPYDVGLGVNQAVIDMLREEIRQRDDLINSVNEENQETRQVIDKIVIFKIKQFLSSKILD